MPIYEYFCETCQDKFELLRPFSKVDAPAICPACHKENSRRLLSRFACISKGDGASRASSGNGGCNSCASHSCAGCKH